MYTVKIVDVLKPEDKEVSYAKYTAPDIAGNVTYLIGSRPDGYPMTREFYNSVDGWISVTDTPSWFVEKTECRWFPWHEGRECPPEILYAVIHTLTLWTQYKHFKTIYIHCDAGTHRAPTVFGAWLLGRYGRKEAKKIVAGVELVRRENLSDPLDYIDDHLWGIPEDLVLIKQTAKSILNRYDGIIHTMEARWARRYQDDREAYK